MVISNELRKAIEGSDQSIYAIAKGSGVAHPVIIRFMQGRDIRLQTVDRLCEHLGLRLTDGPRPQTTKKRRRR